jgi:RND family efflux transporter MFP subunit
MRGPVVLAALLALSGCSREEAPPADPLRPVLSVVVEPRAEEVQGYAGTIQPKVRTDLGFRVLGRITARDVKVGDAVVRGQRVAAIDPTALELAVQAAGANLASANAQFANASGAEERQRALFETRTATQAALDAAVQARDSARAAAARAKAALDKAQEQLGYANLAAEFDGVVTATPADIGQVVAPGQAVVTIAQPKEREAVVDIPEWQDAIRAGTGFTVALELDAAIRAHGRVREVAPEADKVTRTRRVRIALEAPPEAFRLGATILAKPDIEPRLRLELPQSAILHEEEKHFVFVVDGGQVRRRGVTLAPGNGGGAAIVTGGLEAGVRVVTAGVHSLKDGQAIKPAEAGR